MRPWAPERRPGEAGFTLIELMVAMTLIAVVALAAGAGFASSTRFANGSEARQNLVNRAQRQLEYLQSLPYRDLAHTAALTGSATAGSPLSDVNATNGTYRWDRSSGGAATAEPLVVDAQGALTSASESWSDGSSSGTIYTFVTWVTDSRCGGGCPTSRNYKRITVAATLDSGGPPVAPVYIASIVSDPHATPLGKVVNGQSNPLADPQIKCTDQSTGTQSDCTQSVGSSSLSQWYLTDTAANGTYAVPSASHAPHPTVACAAGTSSGCPMPDLLSPTPTPAADPVQALYDYATGVSAAGGYPGGRLLRRDVGCSSTPSADNTKGAQWVTAPLTAPLVLTGQGGMSLTTQTLNGATASATICLGLYDGTSLTNLSTTTPLGVLSYTLASWPTEPTPVSFTFDFVSGGTVTVPAGHRVLARLWVAPSSGADIALLYDHPDFSSMLQLSSP